MEQKSPRRANGEGFCDFLSGNIAAAYSTAAPATQIPPIIARHWWRDNVDVHVPEARHG